MRKLVSGTFCLLCRWLISRLCAGNSTDYPDGFEARQVSLRQFWAGGAVDVVGDWCVRCWESVDVVVDKQVFISTVDRVVEHGLM